MSSWLQRSSPTGFSCEQRHRDKAQLIGSQRVLARKGEGRAHADVRLQLRMKIFWANQIHNI